MPFSRVLLAVKINADLSQITSTNSIMDILLPAIAGLSIDNLQLTLLDDLVTNVKVSDCQKVMVLQSAMAHARRNYADRKTTAGPGPAENATSLLHVAGRKVIYTPYPAVGTTSAECSGVVLFLCE